MRLKALPVPDRRWRPRVSRRAGAGLAVLLMTAGAPLAGAPPASAQTCQDNIAAALRANPRIKTAPGPEDGNHIVCQHMTIVGDFTDRKLMWADFTGSTFRNAHLTGAHLEHANFTDVTFGSGTTIDGTFMTDATLHGAKLTNNTVLSASEITGTQLIPPRQLTVDVDSSSSVVTSTKLGKYTTPIGGAEFAFCRNSSNVNVGHEQPWPIGGPYHLSCAAVSVEVDPDYGPYAPDLSDYGPYAPDLS
jgi:hypothetical protein